MKPVSSKLIALLCVAVLLFSSLQAVATCGGGGGGGVGGASPSVGGDAQVYQVPWKLLDGKSAPVTAGLVLYWFPSSAEEFQESPLRVSRSLALYASQCITMEVADGSTPLAQKLIADAKLPLTVLATPDGNPIGKVESNDGKIKVEQVEKLVDGEFKQRETSVNQMFKQAKETAKSGDSAKAIPIFRAVLEQKCMFPGKAKDAAKELKKLGVTDIVADAMPMSDSPVLQPVHDPMASARIDRTMRQGLRAEIREDFVAAEKLYLEAKAMDPADPAPLRYLGELYRHHTGQWEKARTTFDALLAMPNDPLSRAVALHGLGKMTIHEGDFTKGLDLFGRSIAAFPLPLTYRNLAVYWNSEGDTVKAEQYTQAALKLDPQDPYNLIFAAAFMAGNGHGDEALKIARENQALLPASYNLAAIYAQTGQRDKALALLKRHFFEYERYQAVRSKEMEEARVDAVFASLKKDPAFVALTSGADGRLMPMTGPTAQGSTSGSAQKPRP